ncbi:MAG: hypothetical protein ABIZ18_14125 [Caldimonas sp.]
MMLRIAALALATTALAACSSMHPTTGSAMAAADAPNVDIVLLPNIGAAQQVTSGCWATFFDDRNFAGSSLTLVGPAELGTLDKGAAKQLKRDIKSVATGPRATLVLYQKQFLSARSVGFGPGTREGGLVEKLGFGGRIESMQLRCS